VPDISEISPICFVTENQACEGAELACALKFNQGLRGAGWYKPRVEKLHQRSAEVQYLVFGAMEQMVRECQRWAEERPENTEPVECPVGQYSIVDNTCCIDCGEQKLGAVYKYDRRYAKRN